MRVLGICGSLRRDSWNRKLLALVLEVARAGGHETQYLDYGDVPLYNYDVEVEGFPPQVERMREAIRRAQAVVIACPEYNNSVPGVLKNAVDWASRRPNAFEGKVALIVGASTGRSGAARAHMHLTYILESIGVWTVPTPRVLLPNVANVIAPDGRLLDESVAPLLEAAVGRLLTAAERLAAD